MCMIAYRPIDRESVGSIPAAVIDTALARHPDGFGIMWRDTSGDAPVLRTATYAPSERATFRATLVAIDASGEEYAAHFRMATSGPKDAAMAHPYTYEDPDPTVGTVGIVHNGVIGIAHDRATESDTAAFVRLVLARLPSRWWDDGALVYLVSEAIGWSKLTVMTAEETAIINENSGKWDGDIWYSSSHLPTGTSAVTVYSPTTWTPASVPVGPKPETVKVISRREQRRLNRAERRAAKRAARSGSALVVATAMDPRGAPAGAPLTHAGHLVRLTGSWNGSGDTDLVGGVTCVECDTTGDGYRIDGRWYFDIAHYGPAGLTLVPASASLPSEVH